MAKKYVHIQWIKIPPCPPDKSGAEWMGQGHEQAAKLAWKAQALGMLTTPDSVFSDGALTTIMKRVDAGAGLILTPALRFSEEHLFQALYKRGVDPIARKNQTPLMLQPRRLVSAALESMHSETMRYEWGSPAFTDFPSAVWWRVNHGEGVRPPNSRSSDHFDFRAGAPRSRRRDPVPAITPRDIIVHSFSWAMLCMDYSALRYHDSTCFIRHTADGDYLWANWGTQLPREKIHVIRDSDELFTASWAPWSDREQSLTPRRFYEHPRLGEWLRGGTLNAAYNSPVFDPLKRELFREPVFWHSGEGPLRGQHYREDGGAIDWLYTESVAQRVITRYTGGLTAGVAATRFVSAVLARSRLIALTIRQIRWRQRWKDLRSGDLRGVSRRGWSKALWMFQIVTSR